MTDKEMLKALYERCATAYNATRRNPQNKAAFSFMSEWFGDDLLDDVFKHLEEEA